MKTATYDELYDDMVPDLGGKCTQPLMLKALQNAGRRFCKKTEAWIEQLDPVNLVSTQREYVLDWDDCATVARIVEVRQNTAAGIAAGNKGAITKERFYEWDGDETLTFLSGGVPSYDVTNGLEVKAAFFPHRQTCTIGEKVLEKYCDGILGWAMADLLSQNKPWKNLERALYFQQLRNVDVNKAMQEKQRGYKMDSTVRG